MGKRLAIVLDNKIISAPVIREAITGGNGSISGNNPNISLNAGDTMVFYMNTSGHPFYIKNTQTTGTSGGASGVTNNGAVTGTITYTPPSAGTFYYICSIHGGMSGTITVS